MCVSAEMEDWVEQRSLSTGSVMFVMHCCQPVNLKSSGEDLGKQLLCQSRTLEHVHLET